MASLSNFRNASDLTLKPALMVATRLATIRIDDAVVRDRRWRFLAGVHLYFARTAQINAMALMPKKPSSLVVCHDNIISVFDQAAPDPSLGDSVAFELASRRQAALVRTL